MDLPNIKMKMKHLRNSRGFTMIELLVVIAVIGVLAVAVLSSINPIEQVNKGRDTRMRSDAAQLINAVDRYFALHEIYPWNDAKYNTALAANTMPDIAYPDNTCTNVLNGLCIIDNAALWVNGLSATQEVKNQFVARLFANRAPFQLQVMKAQGYNSTMYVCFQPASRAFQDEALKKCVDGPIGNTATSAVPTEACPNAPYNAQSTYSQNAPELICLP
jgi:prepilin-type N-terminal cleavage/methylation domain-containing protein